ncbi:MAG: acyl-CoA dehydrogenase family protein [Mycetocola sp.]
MSATIGTRTSTSGASERAAAEEEYERLAAPFRPIFARIAAGATDREIERRLPFEEIRWLREAGFGAVSVPVEFGGAGASVPHLFRLLIELAEADSNIPQLLRAHFTVVETLAIGPESASRDRWLRLIGAGAIFGNATHERSAATVGKLSTRLEPAEGGGFVTGVKHYSTGALFADWILVAAVDINDNPLSVTIPGNAPGVDRKDDWDGFGQRLTGSGTTVFDRVFVPETDIEANDFSEPSHITGFLQLVLLASLVGVGRAALRDATAFVSKRTRVYSQGLADRAADDPLVQQVVGRLSALVYAAQATTLAAAQAVGAASDAAVLGRSTEATAARAERESVQAQLLVTQLVLEATTQLFEVGGASAISEALRLDRHWRNARTISSHNPAIYQSRAIGDHLLNGDALLYTWSTGEGAKA